MRPQGADADLASAVSQLGGRFYARLDALHASLDVILGQARAGDMPDLDGHPVHTEIHSIAGLAGFFGESDLGTAARHLDDVIRSSVTNAEIACAELTTEVAVFHDRLARVTGKAD